MKQRRVMNFRCSIFSLAYALDSPLLFPYLFFTVLFCFQINATEPQTSTGFSDITNVTIAIQDVNEFNPTYSESSYTAVVNKSSSSGTPIVKVGMQFSS
jgi:muramoyltetrapeptide carboxypeptidase LdcA involved in peptidoglycan recycling